MKTIQYYLWHLIDSIENSPLTWYESVSSKLLLNLLWMFLIPTNSGDLDYTSGEESAKMFGDLVVRVLGFNFSLMKALYLVINLFLNIFKIKTMAAITRLCDTFMIPRIDILVSKETYFGSSFLRGNRNTRRGTWRSTLSIVASLINTQWFSPDTGIIFQHHFMYVCTIFNINSGKWMSLMNR